MLHLGILGCGSISDHYLRGATQVFSNRLTVEACSDLVIDRAKASAKQFHVKKALTFDELLRDEDIDMMVNLTVPKAHFETTMTAITAGKHVYTEKPFALNRKEAAAIIEAANQKGVIVGCAPDTFMSAPVQTAKKLIEENVLGDIVGVNGICPLRGNEFWHPAADFFYQKGAGPIWDMAAYYFNIVVSLFGPFRSVVSMGRKTWETRTYECEERRGDTIKVEVPTHTVGLFELESGLLFNFTNSFDIYSSRTPYLEIYGKIGTLVLPFPNFYQGDVLISLKGGEFTPVTQLAGYENFMRGVGIADIDACLQNGKKPLASTELAYHVTDAMCAWEEAIAKGKKIAISSTCAKPEGMWLREALR